MVRRVQPERKVQQGRKALLALLALRVQRVVKAQQEQQEPKVLLAHKGARAHRARKETKALQT
jgi:hypothetical protein